MLAQLLNREFLLNSLESLRGGLSQEANLKIAGDHAAVEALESAELEVDDLRNAEEALRVAIEREAATASDELDESAFFPRDEVLSLAQSAWLRFYEERKPGMIQPTLEARAGRPNSKIAVTDIELEGIPATGEGARGLIGKFQQADIRWASIGFAVGVRFFRGRRPFNPHPASPVKISNRARIILLGDWGSGLPRARDVGAAIRRLLMEGDDAATRDQHVIHLGDVYYSGWEREYRKNFLPYWPVKEGEENKFSSWALNANHDMYSGGQGYFDYLLKDPRFHKQEQSSYFSLENDYWQILGLDTGYEKHDLAGGQAQWVHEKLLGSPNKDGILLSHHQLFSAYGEGEGAVGGRLQVSLDKNLIRGWFWGHEHRCVAYGPLRKVEYPRCIGHAGIPVYTPKKPQPRDVLYEYREGFKKFFQKWAYFGFAVLDFEDEVIHVRYINENGDQHNIETLVKKAV